MIQDHTRIQAEIHQARAQGQPLREAELRARLAEIHSEAQQWREAAQELHWAAQLALQEGAMAPHAEYLFEKGERLTHAPGLSESAARALRKACAAARVAGKLTLALSASQALVTLWVEIQAWDKAASATGEVIELLDSLGRKAELCDALEKRASYLHRMDREQPSDRSREGALRDMSRAVALAELQDDLRRSVELRLMRRILRDFVWEEGAPISALHSELELDHDADPFADESLGQAMAALQAGMSETGNHHATAARDAALESADPLRYMLASLLLAEAAELAGDQPGALRALLSCKATLEKSQGKQAGHPIRLVLNALRHRWGDNAMADAIQAYSERLQ
ncbi:MAG: hypothetical protein ACI9VR_000692 [Cognaticolwellia sp.]